MATNSSLINSLQRDIIMEIYLVGGAVRDMLRGEEPEDKDWVIVGATENDIKNLIRQGYTEVGKDFPVFLHPETQEEYAIARIERKVGFGYTGFTCETENVTLEQDLARRDLTMNAIAYHVETDTFIDPFHGRADIENGIIRHVSDAFKEDPVRVIRAARFAAKFDYFIAEETMDFMIEMKDAGELDHLVADRVMKEMKKAAESAIRPSMFIEVLRECEAWDVLFPEVLCIENDQLNHIDAAVSSASDADKFTMFMALMLYRTCDEDLQALQRRVVMPSKVFRFARRVAEYSADYSRALDFTAEETVNFFDELNVRNNGGELFLQRMGDTLFARDMLLPETDQQLLRVYDLYIKVNIIDEITRQGKLGITLQGVAIRDRLREMRIEAIETYKS